MAESVPISFHVQKHYVKKTFSLADQFSYLSDSALPGHSVEDNDLKIYAFGFDGLTENSELLHTKHSEFADVLRQIPDEFAAAKKTRRMNKATRVDAWIVRIDLNHGLDLYRDAKALATRLAATEPHLRSFAVVHENRRSGERGWHMHFVILARERFDLSAPDAKESHWYKNPQLKSFTALKEDQSYGAIRKEIKKVYKKAGLVVRDARNRGIPKAASIKIEKLARIDAIRDGITTGGLRAAVRSRTQDIGWLKKLAEDTLVNVPGIYAATRAAASKKMSHVQVNELYRKPVRRVTIDEDTISFQKVLAETLVLKSEIKKPSAAMNEVQQLEQPLVESIVVVPPKVKPVKAVVPEMTFEEQIEAALNKRAAANTSKPAPVFVPVPVAVPTVTNIMPTTLEMLNNIKSVSTPESVPVTRPTVTTVR